MTSRRFAPALALALLIASCSDDSGSTATTGSADTEATTADTTPATLDTTPGTATFTTQPGTEQIAVLGLEPGTAVEAVAPDGTVAATGEADEQGAVLFRELTPGDGWRITAGDEVSDELTVASPDDVPDASLYTEQQT
ncbi:MAG: hypothetical protein KDB12_14555, partial [Ilumatobacter sp.]|nr:hypothetical protein [Ilumatobacter sp.]